MEEHYEDASELNQYKNSRNLNALTKMGNELRQICNKVRVSYIDKCNKCQQPFCSSLGGRIKKENDKIRRVCESCRRAEEKRKSKAKISKKCTLVNCI